MGKYSKTHPQVKDLAKRYRVEKGKNFRLKDYDPGDTAGFKSEKADAPELLQHNVEMMARLQDKLYAENRWGVLLIFQAMDAAGKDGTIKHVMSGLNPQGVQVYSFKSPSAEELDHDYLWRTSKCLPERGRIGIFNRSYYEEVLVVRVHHELLNAEKLPERLVGKKIWEQRYEDINNFEKYLSNNGMVVRKFFLNLSKREQKRRFLSRLDDADKNWKFSTSDIKERGFWKDYQNAYEEMIQNTATDCAPWYVVPADNKWFTRLAVGAIVVQTLKEIDPAYPRMDKAKMDDLKKAKELLTGQMPEEE
ncbi:MAG TPA: polyphosphate kinase 2 family protein [Terriglobales bacterium]|nr:polyphosphate kinase 2 family protein [Terriglobales bacterium]